MAEETKKTVDSEEEIKNFRRRKDNQRGDQQKRLRSRQNMRREQRPKRKMFQRKKASLERKRKTKKILRLKILPID